MGSVAAYKSPFYMKLGVLGIVVKEILISAKYYRLLLTSLGLIHLRKGF